jgi:hypothetical protein
MTNNASQIMLQIIISTLPILFIIITLHTVIYCHYLMFMCCYENENEQQNDEDNEIKMTIKTPKKENLQENDGHLKTTKYILLILRKSKKMFNIRTEHCYRIPIEKIKNVANFVKEILKKKYIQYYERMEELIETERRVVETKYEKGQINKKHNFTNDIYLLNSAVMEKAYYYASPNGFFIEVIELDADNNQTFWEIEKLEQIFANINADNNDIELLANKKFFSKITLEKFIVSQTYNRINNF